MTKKIDWPSNKYKTKKEWLRTVRKRWKEFRKSLHDKNSIRMGCAYYPDEVYKWFVKFNIIDSQMKNFYDKKLIYTLYAEEKMFKKTIASIKLIEDDNIVTLNCQFTYKENHIESGFRIPTKLEEKWNRLMLLSALDCNKHPSREHWYWINIYNKEELDKFLNIFKSVFENEGKIKKYGINRLYRYFEKDN